MYNVEGKSEVEDELFKRQWSSYRSLMNRNITLKREAELYAANVRRKSVADRRKKLQELETKRMEHEREVLMERWARLQKPVDLTELSFSSEGTEQSEVRVKPNEKIEEYPRQENNMNAMELTHVRALVDHKLHQLEKEKDENSPQPFESTGVQKPTMISTSLYGGTSSLDTDIYDEDSDESRPVSPSDIVLGSSLQTVSDDCVDGKHSNGVSPNGIIVYDWIQPRAGFIIKARRVDYSTTVYINMCCHENIRLVSPEQIQTYIGRISHYSPSIDYSMKGFIVFPAMEYNNCVYFDMIVNASMMDVCTGVVSTRGPDGTESTVMKRLVSEASIRMIGGLFGEEFEASYQLSHTAGLYKGKTNTPLERQVDRNHLMCSPSPSSMYI